MPTEFSELRNRVYELMDVGTDRVAETQVTDWLIRAIQELVNLADQNSSMWEVLIPLQRVHSAPVESNLVEYPTNCLKLRSIGEVNGNKIGKIIHIGDKPYFVDEFDRPSLKHPWLVITGNETQLPVIDVRPHQFSGKTLNVTYVATPNGGEVYSEQLTELAVSGAAKIGLQTLGETNRFSEVESRYKEALIKAGIR